MAITLVRRTLLPPVDTLKDRLFGGFALSHSTEDEYAATVYCDQERFQGVLDELGFSPSLFSALKIRFDGNVEDGSWVRRESLLAENQLHVVTHEREDGPGIDAYAHSERSKITHPVAHYRKVDHDAEAGVEQFRDALEEYVRTADESLKFEVRPPHHRTWGWALHLLSFVSTPAAVRIGRGLDRIEKRLASRLPSLG